MSGAKPIPRPDADTRPFWEAAARNELVYRRCSACGKRQFPPRDVCSSCHRPGTEWRTASGRGTIHSFTVVHRAPSAAFKGDVPYVIALIDCVEGFRMMTNLRGANAAGGVAIGRKVRIVFEPTTDAAIKLPQAELED